MIFLVIVGNYIMGILVDKVERIGGGSNEIARKVMFFIKAALLFV